MRRLVLCLAAIAAALACRSVVAMAAIPYQGGLVPPVRLFVLDVEGDGIELCGPRDGVPFDLDGRGVKARIGWTKPGAGDGFIVVDPLAGEDIRAEQLLGTAMKLPDGRRILAPEATVIALQGFELGQDFRRVRPQVTDDVILDARDAVFQGLRLWVDANHDGLAQSKELRSLQAVGITALNSLFWVARAVDEHGNVLGPRSNFAVRHHGVEVFRDIQVVQFAYQ